MSNPSVNVVDKTNEMLPIGQLAALGLQHVLAMYAGAVAVPLIVGGAAGLNSQQLSLLVAIDLFTCGIATLVQALGLGNFAGIRLPAILGVTFAAVGPMVTVVKGEGLAYAWGAIIIAGLLVTLVAPFYGKLLKFFPPVVTGSVITIIGFSLIGVGVKNWGGGAAKMGTPEFGSAANVLLGTCVIILILFMNKFFKGFLQSLSVLIGLVVGTIVAGFMGMVNMQPVLEAKWASLIVPFALGTPKFSMNSIILMSIVMLVVMIESTGQFLAIGKICGRDLTEKEIVRGMRAEGICTTIGGIFCAFPYVTFSQNVGLLAMTKITSRWVVVAAGIILLVLGTIPKFAALATIIPASVLGGATTLMFAMVAVTGIRILSTVDFTKNSNTLVVASASAIGLGVTVVPDLVSQLPSMLSMIFHSGIVAGSIVAVVVNALMNWNELEAHHEHHVEDGAQA